MTSNRDRIDRRDRERRKQAIMVGLSRYLAVEQCVAAAAVWEQHYSRAPGYALQGFVKDLLEQEPSLWPYRHDLFNHLMKTVALPTGAIEAEFASLFQQSIDIDALTDVDQDSQAQRIFEQVYQRLIERLEEEDYAVSVQLRKFLREKMLQGTSFSMETQRLNSWLLGLKARLDVPLSLERMRQILHQAYVGSCEYLGPIQADRLLEEAVVEVEKKSRGEGFSPRDLL